MAKIIRAPRISDLHIALPVKLATPRMAETVATQHDNDLMAPNGSEVAPIKHTGIDNVELQEQQAALNTQVAILQEQEMRLKERERHIEEELDEVRRKVREQAYAEGYQSGEAEATKIYRQRLDTLQRLIDSCKEEFTKEVSGLEDILVEIAFEAVCKIVGSALHTKDGVIAVVAEVMNRVKDQERLIIHVCPQDYQMLYQHQNELFSAGQEAKHKLVPDDRVALGGCLIEATGGTIDGRLEIQLQQLRDTLITARKMLPE